jgi:hypothetical protein
VFVIKCTVVNSGGDTQYDLLEFHINEPPRAGDIAITYPEPTDKGTTFETTYPLTLANWYNAIDDTTQ